MAFSGRSDKKETITAAISANIWMSNEKVAKGTWPDEILNYMVLDCSVREEISRVHILALNKKISFVAFSIYCDALTKLIVVRN